MYVYKLLYVYKVCIYKLYIHTYTHIYTQICMHIYTYIYIHTHVCVNICLYNHTWGVIITKCNNFNII